MTYLYNEAEKYIHDIFHKETHDSSNTLNIPKIISDNLIKDNQEKDPEYYKHREGVIHVSSLSHCLRGVVHEMLQSEKDEKDEKDEARMLGVFKAGNLFEDYIVDCLSDKMLDRQTEYVYQYKTVILTGRDDGTMNCEGTRKMLECKSVHSNAFWHRLREGQLCAYQNQMQIQTYLWLRRILPNMFIRKHEGKDDEIIYTNMDKQTLWVHRGMRPDDKLIPTAKPDESDLNGIFAYVSKDDVTVEQAPVKFNMNIINKTIIPAIETIVTAYDAKNPELAPTPPLTVYNMPKNQHQKNFLCNYCDYHSKCAGKAWAIEAAGEVSRMNREQGEQMENKFTKKPEKVEITAKPYTPPVKGGEGDPWAGEKSDKDLGDSSESDSELQAEPEVKAPPAGETTLERMVRERNESMGT